MRYVLLLLLGVALLSAADNDGAPPQMPAEVTLTTGRVLRNVSVMRWEKDRVVLKHSGGADPIPFTMFKSPTPEELPAIRAAWNASAGEAKKTKQAAVAAGKAPVDYSGELFLGAPGPDAFRLGGVPLFVLPAEALKIFATETGTYALPKPLAQVRTNASGQFSFSLAADQKFVIFAQYQRRASGRVESFEWRLSSDQIADPQHIMIGNDSRRAGNCNYSFAQK